MGRRQEEAREQQALIPAPIATIELDVWWNRPERHGAMLGLAASEDAEEDARERVCDYAHAPANGSASARRSRGDDAGMRRRATGRRSPFWQSMPLRTWRATGTASCEAHGGLPSPRQLPGRAASGMPCGAPRQRQRGRRPHRQGGAAQGARCPQEGRCEADTGGGLHAARQGDGRDHAAMAGKGLHGKPPRGGGDKGASGTGNETVSGLAAHALRAIAAVTVCACAAIAGCAVAMAVLVYAVKALAWAVGATPA